MGLYRYTICPFVIGIEMHEHFLHKKSKLFIQDKSFIYFHKVLTIWYREKDRLWSKIMYQHEHLDLFMAELYQFLELIYWYSRNHGQASILQNIDTNCGKSFFPMSSPKSMNFIPKLVFLMILWPKYHFNHGKSRIYFDLGKMRNFNNQQNEDKFDPKSDEMCMILETDDDPKNGPKIPSKKRYRFMQALHLKPLYFTC